MNGWSYFDEQPPRRTWRDENGRYAPCDERGPYATRCTLDPHHSWSHYDAGDDSSWTDRWKDEAPDDDEELVH